MSILYIDLSEMYGEVNKHGRKKPNKKHHSKSNVPDPKGLGISQGFFYKL